MELKDLVGKHILSGVEYSNVIINDGWRNNNEECVCVKFTLDGTTYTAVEDPEDGYRSACGDIEISEEVLNNSFSGVEVLCTMLENSDYQENDILVITDVVTKKIILEIGTGNCNDYYPYFHVEYIPENMVLNVDK
jgi:hypothetical protein